MIFGTAFDDYCPATKLSTRAHACRALSNTGSTHPSGTFHTLPPPERKDKSQDRTRAAEDRTKDNVKNKTTRMRAHLAEQSYYCWWKKPCTTLRGRSQYDAFEPPPCNPRFNIESVVGELVDFLLVDPSVGKPSQY